MAHRLLRDPTADGWESTDFPVVCEDCLGPNPYVRMQKEEYGQECQISGRPYTVFRWRPGQDARYKKTVICREAALAKNVCQCCILDLETGLPVQVRDAALGAGANPLPPSEVGREYALHQLESAMADGSYRPESAHGSAAGNELLRRLARTAPYYKRNRAKICTFWLRNACTRTDCPFRPCNGDADMPELNADPSLRSQNIRDRYAGTNDPVAERMLRKAEAAGPGGAAGAAGAGAGAPPADASITTLFVGGCDERVDEAALRDHFSPYGELAGVRAVPQRRAAFVTFLQRACAEAAAAGLGGGRLIVKGLRLKVLWGKPAAPAGPAGGGGAAAGVGAGGGRPAPPPPPPPQGGWAAPAAYPSMDRGLMGSAPPPAAGRQ